MASSLFWAACLFAIPHVMAGGQVPSTSRLVLTQSSVKPLIQGPPQYVAEIVSPDYSRDSCCSTRVGGRSLWVCRDSAAYGGMGITFQSTAGWSNLNADGTPAVQNGQLVVTPKNTEAFYPPADNQCKSGSPSGFCSTGRWPIWPDSPPLPVTGLDGSVTLYTWIREVHFPDSNKLGTDSGDFPAISLYRSVYTGAPGDTLPTTTLFKQDFYPANSVPFGQYGWVLGPDGYAYLYGQGRFGTMVARVLQGSIEDRGAYTYWVGGQWVSTPPGPGAESFTAIIPNAGNGQQGTFYYSSYYNIYIWIGQDLPGLIGSPNMVYMTAPRPEGPWTFSTFLMAFPSGGPDFRGQYSFQAHPGMSENEGNGRDIYVSETVDLGSGYKNYLYKIQFQTL